MEDLKKQKMCRSFWRRKTKELRLLRAIIGEPSVIFADEAYWGS